MVVERNPRGRSGASFRRNGGWGSFVCASDEGCASRGEKRGDEVVKKEGDGGGYGIFFLWLSSL